MLARSPDISVLERHMQRVLSIAKPSWLKDNLLITDADGRALYTTIWRTTFPVATWSLKRDDQVIATLRRKALALPRTCRVTMGGTEFVLKNRISVSRRIEVEGGPFDGAVLTGNLSDLNFRLEHQGDQIAAAEGKTFSMHNRYIIHLLKDDPAAEVLTALMLVDLLVQQSEES